MKKAVVTLLVLSLLAGAGWHFRGRLGLGSAAAPEADQPRTAAAAKGPLRVLVQATGRVVPEQEVEIKCKASGQVVRLPVDVSSPVKKDDLLAQIDPQDEERSLRRAEVALAVSQARLAKARLSLAAAREELATERRRSGAALASSRARQAEAAAKLARTEGLLAKGMASPEELGAAGTAAAQAAADLASAEAREAELAVREAQVKSGEEDVRIAEAAVEADQLSLTDARQRRDDTAVRAPMDGVVSSLKVQAGQIVASGINNVGGGTALMSIADLSRMYVLVSVDESDIGKVAAGQKARVTVDAWPEERLPGKVVRVATKGANVSNVVTFEVKVEVEGPRRELLKPEMTASVEITVLDRESALLVPAAAVEGRREKTVTVRRPDGTTEQRTVQAGEGDGERVEILAGLAEGETVVLRPAAAGRWQKDGAKDARQGQRRPPMPFH